MDTHLSERESQLAVWGHERVACWRALARRALLLAVWGVHGQSSMHRFSALYRAQLDPITGRGSTTRYDCYLCNSVAWDGLASLRHEDYHVESWLRGQGWLDPDGHHELADALVLAFERLCW